MHASDEGSAVERAMQRPAKCFRFHQFTQRNVWLWMVVVLSADAYYSNHHGFLASSGLSGPKCVSLNCLQRNVLRLRGHGKILFSGIRPNLRHVRPPGDKIDQALGQAYDRTAPARRNVIPELMCTANRRGALSLFGPLAVALALDTPHAGAQVDGLQIRAVEKGAKVLENQCAPYLSAVRGHLLYRGGGPPGHQFPLNPVTEPSDLLGAYSYRLQTKSALHL